MTVRESLRVRVPGSSANLGPGFDVLGMALSVYAELGIASTDSHSGSGEDANHVVDGRHPARVAFGAAGGRGEVWVRTSIPSGRGLGFSGAVRVGGVALGLAERAGVIGAELQSFIEENRSAILDRAADIEGHADNVAASLFGGVVACSQSHGSFAATRVPLAGSLLSEGRIVVWIPHHQTTTAESRAGLPSMVTRSDAIFNIAHTAGLILALSSGDRSKLTEAVEDRLHQEHRLDHVPQSRRAMEAMRAAGGAACWLSGSGPTVACLVFGDRSLDVEHAVSTGEFADAGRVSRLTIDTEGLQAAR